MPTDDSSKKITKQSALEFTVEALEILLYERDTLDKDDPVWVLDPAFDNAHAALTVGKEALDGLRAAR